MQTIKALFSSKKFLVTLAGVVGIIAAKLGWEAAPETCWQIVILVGSLVTGQGLADFGKEAAR
jgi:hypothetical protein